MKDYSNYISYKDIMSHIDLKEGDIVNVTSDILKLMCVCRDNKEKFDPNVFIDTIIEKIGHKGTLLFSAYNWEFGRGKVFDYHNACSQTGGLSNVALKRKDFRRTKHPIYSFAVWGNDQNYLCNLNNISAFGEDSPFAYLYKRCGKNLFIGIDYKAAFTFTHYIEEKIRVNYRSPKYFTAPYIDENGISGKLTYSMYVRDLSLDAEMISISPRNFLLDDILLSKGYYVKYFINTIYFGVVDLRGIGDIMENDLKSKGGLVYPKPKS